MTKPKAVDVILSAEEFIQIGKRMDSLLARADAAERNARGLAATLRAIGAEAGFVVAPDTPLDAVKRLKRERDEARGALDRRAYDAALAALRDRAVHAVDYCESRCPMPSDEFIAESVAAHFRTTALAAPASDLVEPSKPRRTSQEDAGSSGDTTERTEDNGQHRASGAPRDDVRELRQSVVAAEKAQGQSTRIDPGNDGSTSCASPAPDAAPAPRCPVIGCLQTGAHSHRDYFPLHDAAPRCPACGSENRNERRLLNDRGEVVREFSGNPGITYFCDDPFHDERQPRREGGRDA